MLVTQNLDNTGSPYEYEGHGNLYVRREPDQSFIPRFAKTGDVGLDLPVKINIDQIKFDTESGSEKPDKLRSVMLYPELKQYIYPNGFNNDGCPCLDIPAFGWAEIPSALAVKLPDDAWGLIKTRSCTAWKQHLMVSCSTIDPGYTGLLGTLVYNPNHVPVRVYEYNTETGVGDRLSQLILIPIYPLHKIILVDYLPKTDRGTTGFGSSGCSHE
jgi:dUTPase